VPRKQTDFPADVDRPAAAPKSRIKGEERRARYLQAAADIIVEQGVSFVTMEEVAARNGVDKRLGYRYFSNRESLLTALFEQEMQEVGRRALAALPAKPTLRDHITANVGAWLELAAERGALLSRLFSDQDVIPAVARAIVDRAVQHWGQLMREGLAMSPSAAETLSRIYLSGLRGAVEAVEARTMPVAEVAAIYATATYAGAEAVAAGCLGAKHASKGVMSGKSDGERSASRSGRSGPRTGIRARS
jgi:AcrR family transcriptional regulator